MPPSPRELLVHRTRLAALLSLLGAIACAPAAAPPPGPGQPGTQIAFDDEADLTQPQSFFAFPWPSDLRLTAAGTPEMSGFPYPVKNNRASAASVAYTGVVVQYSGDGIEDPHAIYRQLDAVKYQYGCFLDSFLRTGAAAVVAPQPAGTPCP